jgi:hypothetical protein
LERNSGMFSQWELGSISDISSIFKVASNKMLKSISMHSSIICIDPVKAVRNEIVSASCTRYSGADYEARSRA